MEEGNGSENHLTSVAAFVEGGIQEACDNDCSICLEAFCDSDPSTLTSCKHEFHLQCILEWCQRRSQCPMCWQAISLKDPSSQELLDAVEHERNLRMNPPRNPTIFRHPTLGDFELQHLPVSASESELEERIIQHLAAAAAMGRARQLARREGHRNRSSAQGRPHYLVFSTNPTEGTSPTAQRDSDVPSPTVTITAPDSPLITVGEDSALAEQLMNAAPGSSAGVYQHRTPLNNRRSPVQTSPSSQDRAGPSDLHSFSETLKSRLSALSTRYKESIAKGTRSWKDRLFARNSSTPVPSTEAHREADQINTPPARGIGTVSRMMDHLQMEQQQDVSTPAASANNSEDSTASVSTEPQTITVDSGSGSSPGPSNRRPLQETECGIHH